MEKNKIKFLVVDDEEPILDIVKECLTRDGYQNIQTANSAQEAIKIIQNNPIDVLITDMRLPDKDGTEILKIANTTPYAKDVKKIIMTGYCSPEQTQTAIQLGCTRIITKPFICKEFLNMIEKITKCS